ncbi:tryptophan halogenase family protein [Cellvibrio polysaccharolyticus]|uniref:Tryptophan 7-halogenase n=1 Tax=Cellvibrio polysaccharolyticus TaxID=2082724 RepID=A0A928YW93_9GAMM|nr:tryptophan halogenase family protein [Cellvibrio polysaccharolyticus]MBE8717973.1 tryptophan 7-halogenase [Cellvibrio polysaccharolyticus]
MADTTGKPEKILIVGGGTAGWMAANLIVSRWNDVEVCLLESTEIGIIGVGEGSTPHLKFFFDTIGVTESEWMSRCNATYKNGISFAGWSSVTGFESYFHPFPAQVDDYTVPVFFEHTRARLQGKPVNAHPDHYFLETYLTKHNLGPIPAESFPFGVAYGYHFDSHLLGQFLAEKALSRGVKRVFGTLTEVIFNADEELASVRLSDDSFLDADFFVDCSGFKSLLMQGALKVNFKSFKDNLFNNAAVVMPTPISREIPPETRSTALSNGWAWKIPLTNRYGNGYVYSNEYITPEQAETELRQHLNVGDSDVAVRHLQMKVGRAEKHWEKNCVAVGLSQGFIEPLEATALALSCETVMRFMKHYENGSYTNKFSDNFNQEINAKFEGVRDYIVCHYKVNQRKDTDYWRDNAANTHLSENLEKILHFWRHSEDFSRDMHLNNLVGSYQPKSWACLLAGYGVFPSIEAHVRYQSPYDLVEVADFIRRCGLNFKTHNELLS